VDQGLPLVILSALCGLALLALLLKTEGLTGRKVDERSTNRPVNRVLLRPLAAGAVVSVIWGWGVAQFPYLLPTSLRIDQAAAPDPTLTVIFIVFAIAAVLVLPSLGLLYVLSQRDLLEAEH
jgi:cytochrome d ubiquinol oxidase subunit II